MKKLSLLFIIVLFNTVLFAQWVSNGERLSFTIGNHHSPVISATKEGGSYITWVNSDSTSTGFFGNILLNALDAQGNILPGFPFHGIAVTTVGSQWAPVVITSEDDEAILVWQGRNSPNGMLHIYAQKYSQAGTPLWNSGQPIAISPSNNNQDEYPIVISDRHNGFYVTWNRDDSLIDFEVSNIWLQHIDSTGNVANGWDKAGIDVASYTTYQYYPQLVLSNDGSAIYVMYSSGDIGISKLLLKKFSASDGKQMVSNLWLQNGLLLSPGPYLYLNINYDQFIFCDNQNNVVVFWSELRYGTFIYGEVYMQRISPTGTIMLSGYGKYITGKNNGMGTDYMEAVKDPDGNFLVTCTDFASGANIDALKIKANGEIIWQYLTTNGTSAYPKPITDGNKGMYVFFENASASPYLLQAIALDSTGTPYKTWSGNVSNFGVINESSFSQDDFTITSVKPARALVTWNRYDTDVFNVYACNMQQDGTNCNFDASYVKELVNNNSIEIFPNPFNSVINIQQSSNTYQNLTFKLYDITGKVLLNEKLNSTNTELQTPNLSNGIYFYNITNAHTSIKRGKLIKE